MADFSVSYASGFTLYALIFDPAERAWNGTVFIDPAGQRPTCAVAMVDNSADTYTGTIPATVPAGTYTVRAYLQLGGTPADDDAIVGGGTVVWPGSAAGTAAAGRDWHVLEGVRDRLAETGEFDDVLLPHVPETHGTGQAKIAAVSPLDWDDGDVSDDAANAQDTVRVRFQLTLVVRHEDGAVRDAELDRLSNVCKAAINGQPLVVRGGESLTVPGWTKLRRGKWEAARPPERRKTIVGETAYFIDGDHDTEE